MSNTYILYLSIQAAHEKGFRDFHQQWAENLSAPILAAGNLYVEWPHAASPIILTWCTNCMPENANRSHGHGALHLSSFEPYAKNPPISKVFREIELADELGSGMRNTYKYTKLYSGGTPEFIEGDVFRTVIPLTPVAVEKVGPQDGTQVRSQVETQVRTQVLITDQILTFCAEPRSKAEIAEHCGYKNTKSFTKRYMRPLLDNGQLQMTIPDKPRSQHQKYVTAQNSQ